jgi:hypothetical protein
VFTWLSTGATLPFTVTTTSRPLLSPLIQWALGGNEVGVWSPPWSYTFTASHFFKRTPSPYFIHAVAAVTSTTQTSSLCNLTNAESDMTTKDVIMPYLVRATTPQRALTDQYTAVVEWPVAGKNQSDSEKRMLQCHLLHQKSHIKYLGLNLRLW